MESLLHMLPLASDWLKDADSGKTELRTEQGNEQLKSALAKLHHSCANLLVTSSTNEPSLALLFQCAVSYASEGCRVWFIRRQPLDKIPMCVHGMPNPDASVLKNIKFVYYSRVHDVMEFCAGIHTQTVLPDAIIVDGLQQFTHDSLDSQDQVLVKLFCLLIDAAQFVHQKSEKTVPLVMSVQLDDRLRFLDSVFWRFPVQLAALSQKSDAGGHSYSLTMRVGEDNLACHFSSREATLVLSEVIHETIANQVDPP